MMKFNEKYNHDEFCDFLKQFLPEDYTEKEKDITEIDKCKVITEVKELGYSESLDVYVLEMTHSKDTDPRVTIATDAFRILANYSIDKALVIFKNNNSENYRFSYLTISLDLDDKNKIIRKYSNARRYSFYLGVGAKIRTPEKQLIAKGKVEDIDDLLNRFSLEVVNKQFYLEIAKHFDSLVSDSSSKLSLPSITDINTRKSFAVRLIGRIMFCWFLKQKKSDNGQLIPDELLSASAVKENYYHDVLERLFFEVLNTNLEERDVRSDLYDKVPYLNGGLFSPQSEDYYELDRETGFSRYLGILRIDDEWFKGFFELLETYNFTIDENTVFDQELSVDPEMLGRIFENLLAEINPETGSSERKRTGSFYTPRQIVEYMVDQSLLEYLKTKTGIEEEKLKALISYDESDDRDHPLLEDDNKKIIDAIESLRVLDPACGSGAFPIGVLQKLVYILQVIDEDGSMWRNKKLKNVSEYYRRKIEESFDSQDKNYIRKLEIIKNSIFGVDIQPIAVEVSRLRCFLTLVVDDKIDDLRKNRGIDPLPNLDFKFVCANTLIPAPDKEIEEVGDMLFRDPFQEKFASVADRYFSYTGVNKANAGTEIHKLIDEKVDLKLKYIKNLISYDGNEKFESARAKINEKQIKEHARVIQLWRSYKNIFENKPVGFFDTKYFFPSIKDGFDIVIGNPPYIKEYTDRSAFDGLRESPYYQGKMDIWYMFSCIGLDFLKNSGLECYIAQNNWVTSAGASKMRKKILGETQIISLADFGNHKIFETAGIQTMIMLFKKNGSKDNYKIDYRRLHGDKLIAQDAYDLLQGNKNVNAEYLTPTIDVKELDGKKITFSNPDAEVILNKLASKCNFQLTEKEVANGIHHHHDRVNKARREVLEEKLDLGAGIFVLSNNEKMALHLTESELDIIKPSYTTKELSKWYGDKQNKEWVIYTDSSFKNKDKILNYPHIKSHLDQFEEVITSDNKPYGLHRARDEYFFKGEKIIAVRKCAKPTFTYVNFDSYVSATFYVIKTERLNQKYLTALLNSKLIAFWLRNKGKMQGSNFQIDKEPILDLPIFAPKKDAQERLAKITDEIITLKKSDQNADISGLEKQIDELVMDLYELTEEEKEIIRNS